MKHYYCLQERVETSEKSFDAVTRYLMRQNVICFLRKSILNEYQMAKMICHDVDIAQNWILDQRYDNCGQQNIIHFALIVWMRLHKKFDAINTLPVIFSV